MQTRRILMICKASVKEGLGHMIRSLTLADYISEHFKDINLSLMLVSDLDLSHKLEGKNYACSISQKIDPTVLGEHYESIILDMLSMEPAEIKLLRTRSQKIISISPIFNQMSRVDLLITRTKYIGEDHAQETALAAGLNYAIIRKDCNKISSRAFEENLKKETLHIAISMGGTDPTNNTLKVIDQLKSIQQPAVFWVMIGEGYGYQFEDLVSSINKADQHEIIIAKTNRSMWQIMSNCNLAILAGGISSYEAAYAGLPAINYFAQGSRSYLAQELEEKKLCLPICSDIKSISTTLLTAISNKKHLMKIHQNCMEQYKQRPVHNVADLICKAR